MTAKTVLFLQVLMFSQSSSKFSFQIALFVLQMFTFSVIQFITVNTVSCCARTPVIISDDVILHGPWLVFTLETERYSSYCMKVTKAIACKH